MRLLLADDLTGACDAGVMFAKGRVLVGLGPDSFPAGFIPPAGAVLAVNCQSRLLKPHEAAQIVGAVARKMARFRPAPVFKKIDSTMRGNIAAEIDAILAAFQIGCALIAPAAPAQGRRVKNGVLLVNGVSLHKTAFARDPLNPMTESAVKAILRGQSAKKGVELAPDGDLAAKIGETLKAGVEYLIFDAESEADLEKIAAAGLALSPAPLFAGSAGLAGALAKILPIAATEKPRLFAERVFFVCGSAHEATARQIAILEKAGVPVLRMTETDALDLEGRGAELLAGGSLVLAAPGKRVADPEKVSLKLSKIALAILAKTSRKPALCIAGGETAYSLLSGLASFLELRGEISPGIVAGVLGDGAGQGQIAVTKAGGFGGDEALLEVMTTLAGK